MNLDWGVIFFVLLLIDSLGAIIMSWFGQKWWISATGKFADFFPPAKGWSLMYFVLVIIIGHLLGVV